MNLSRKLSEKVVKRVLNSAVLRSLIPANSNGCGRALIEYKLSPGHKYQLPCIATAPLICSTCITTDLGLFKQVKWPKQF